jgi:hypothetical protein
MNFGGSNAMSIDKASNIKACAEKCVTELKDTCKGFVWTNSNSWCHFRSASLTIDNDIPNSANMISYSLPYNEAPNTDGGCTHKEAHNSDYEKIKACKSLVKTDCSIKEYCSWLDLTT